MDVHTLSNEEALELTRRGASILALSIPTGREFGLDLQSYTVGEAAVRPYTCPASSLCAGVPTQQPTPWRAASRPCSPGPRVHLLSPQAPSSSA